MKLRIATVPLFALLLAVSPAVGQDGTAVPAESKGNPLLFPEPIDVNWPAFETDSLLPEASDNGQPHKQFTEGSWTIHGFGGTLVGDEDKGRLHSGTIGVGYFFEDGWSINAEALGGYADAEFDDNGGVGGVDAIFRYHFLRGNGWSIYNDFGAGVQMATTEYPSDSHFNFRLHLGVGGTLNLVDNVNLMGGVRYLHISNAGMTEINAGQDGAFVYMGLMLTY